MMFPVSAYAAIIGIAILFVVSRLRAVQDIPSGSKRPPGPKGKPIVGNLLDINPYHSWLQFFSWARQYGPLYNLDIAGRDNVIVSTEKIANDLLRERGTLYSSREQLPMGAQLLSNNLRPLLLPYNDLWRRGRKLMHHLTMTTVASSYEPLQTEECVRMLRDLIREPRNYETWFERFSAGLIMRLGYGKMVYTGEEPYVRQILEVVHTVERVVSPGAYLVDTLPVLMWLPAWLAPFKREGRSLHERELVLFRGLLQDVKDEMNSNAGVKEESFSSRFLEKQEEYGLSFDEAAYVVGTLFEAGAGTTPAAMMSFMQAMVKHPKSFEKLQQELDGTVGDRIPTFDDIKSLPRVRANIKETLRWRPVTAGGVPHQLVKDDVYSLPGTEEKIFLAAGSNIHANQWAIHREEALYPDPESYRPERWLEPSWPTYREPLSTYPNIQNFSAFGFGRRICPGQNIAERSLNIQVAMIAWACDIGPAKNSSGKAIELADYDYTKGFNVQPNKFPFSLRPRKGRDAIVEKEWQQLWATRIAENEKSQGK